MMYWLRLIRWKNLLIVFATQLLVWYCLVYTSARIYYQRLTLDWVHFFPVCLSTLLITAAGYIINDYFDIKIDIINRPEKVVLEKKIPLRDAIIAHTLLNVGGLIAVFPIAYSNRHVHWLLLQLGCMVLLWFYSTHFKRQFIIGNVVVALLTALTIVVLVIYEQLMYKYIGMPVTIRYINNTYYINPIWICAGYATFAFMLTWMREVVKDMEDHEGDAEQGCQTMPIVKGLQFSAYFVVALGAITVILLGIIAGILFSTAYYVMAFYTIILLFLPLIAWCYKFMSAGGKQVYHIASRQLKIIMLLGISSLLIYFFTIKSII